MCVCTCSCVTILCVRARARGRERVIVGNKVTFQLLPGVWVRQRRGRIRDSQLAFCSICFNLLCFPSLLIYLSFSHTFLSFFSFFLSTLFYFVPISSPLTFQFLCPTSCLPKRRIIYSRGVCLNYTDPYNIYMEGVGECSHFGTTQDYSWQQFYDVL